MPSDDLFQTDEFYEEAVEETDWLRKAIRDEAPEESTISTDAPTLVSETQWKDSDSTINDQPTIPSNKTVIGRSDPFPLTPLQLTNPQQETINSMTCI